MQIESEVSAIYVRPSTTFPLYFCLAIAASPGRANVTTAIPFDLPWLLHTKNISFSGPTVFLNKSYTQKFKKLRHQLSERLTSTSRAGTSTGNCDNKILLHTSFPFLAPALLALFTLPTTLSFHAGAGMALLPSNWCFGRWNLLSRAAAAACRRCTCVWLNIIDSCRERRYQDA